MFQVVYMNDTTRQATLQAGPFNCLRDAAKARRVSGDLVVDDKGVIVQDQAWLWDYEKKDIRSYAHRCLLQRVKVKEILKYIPGNAKMPWTSKMERVWP